MPTSHAPRSNAHAVVRTSGSASYIGHARKLAKTPVQIDYFATSLPTMLLFADDLTARQRTTALFLEAQARLGLGQTAAAHRLLRQVLRRDPAHAAAHDLQAG